MFLISNLLTLIFKHFFKLMNKILFILISLTLIVSQLNYLIADPTVRDSSETIVKDKEISESASSSLSSYLIVLEELLEKDIKDDDTSKTKAYVGKAHGLYQKVKAESRIVEILDFSRTQNLPIAINKNLSGIDYMVVIDSMIFTPQGGMITSYMSLEIPQNQQRIAFRGASIKFNKSGIAANARLELIEDYSLNFGEKILLNLKAQERKTFIAFDCKGYKNMGIQAELEFSRDLIVPENIDGSLMPEPARVKGLFEVNAMREWGEIITKINLPAFQVKGLKGFGFKITDAVLDLSEVANAPGLIFPTWYNSDIASSPNHPLWQGLYIREATISMPPQFETTEQKRLTFFASNLLIDELGVSGALGAKNLLSLDRGTMDGWKFSIDSLFINLSSNQLLGGGLGGRLGVPILGEEPLKYQAVVNIAGNYLFNVTATGQKKIPLWMAEATIDKGSGVEIRLTDTKFLPRVFLNGTLSVGNANLKLTDIRFEQLQLQTVVPYIKVGAMSFGSNKDQQKVSGFPITIKEIGVNSKGSDIGLSITAAVNFVGENDGGFGGEGSFTVWGEHYKVEGRHQLKFKTIELREIKIDIDGGAFKLKGMIASYKQHPLYGRGFKGAIEASFTPGLKVAAMVQFGSVNDYRYWYADALAILPQGIPVAPGFGLYGFGGGAYYHMKRELPKPVQLPEDTNKNPIDTTSEAGKSLSGVKYLPDNSKGLGIKATVVIATYPSPQPFNADATFEITFNTNGGLDYIAFGGDAYFMTAINKRNAKAPIFATLRMEYDVPNKSLFGNLTVFMNVAGGMIRGIQPDNKAGTATLYFAPHDWYIHIGTPDQRIGLKMMNIFQANSYFMVGTKMPGMPEPPAQVKGILKEDFGFMRDENALRSGGGFAFGANLSMSTGDLRFTIFYARLDAGAGFDIMLKNYGEGVRCAGRTEPLGINGWYASGQAYAYVQGKIGIKVDLTFVKGEYDIIKLGAAAILQAKLPNPFWMQGTVGGYYSILGGLVSGHCKFKMTIGEQCTIEGGSALSGIKIIAETSPANNERKVNVFNAPQAAFNIPINKTFELVDIDDQRKSFRATLDYFKPTELGQDIQGKLTWNPNKDVVVFQSFEILPPKKIIKLMLKVHFEELVAGVWQTVKLNNKPIEETIESSFETGEAPDYIPESNVLYSYPALNQFNFHKQESPKGYIQLRQGQTYLFPSTTEWKQLGRFQNEQQKHEFDFKYNTGERRITFNIPTTLVNNNVYSLQLLNVPTVENAKIDANVKDIAQGAADRKITTKDIEGSLSLLSEKLILASNFKTSKFSTFSAKLNALQYSSGWIWDIYTGVNELGSNISTSEYFDRYELLGTDHSKPLIQFEAILDNRWFTKDIFPLIYKEYPLAGNIFINWRKTEELGLPPSKAIYLRQNPNDKILSTTDVSNNGINSIANYVAFIYNLSYITYKDYNELREKASITLGQGNRKESITSLVTSYYPILSSGKYKFKVHYVLPGSNQVTSEKEFTIIKP